MLLLSITGDQREKLNPAESIKDSRQPETIVGPSSTAEATLVFTEITGSGKAYCQISQCLFKKEVTEFRLQLCPVNKSNNSPSKWKRTVVSTYYIITNMTDIRHFSEVCSSVDKLVVFTTNYSTHAHLHAYTRTQAHTITLSFQYSPSLHYLDKLNELNN